MPPSMANDWSGSDGRLDPIAQTLHAFCFGAVVAAEKPAVILQAVADDLDAAMVTRWRKYMNGAFETVENVSLAAHDDLKGFVVLVAATLTNGH
jgi:hypothetical protein